jgi:CTP-dependent riboflavin kinase
VEEVANAFLALMFNCIRAQIVGRITEGLGEGKGTAF